jgi:hypothetical protein
MYRHCTGAQPSPYLGLLIVGCALFSFLVCGNALADEPLRSEMRTIPMPDPATLGPEVWAQDRSLPNSPPDNPEVGDSWLWWLHIHYPMPPHFEQVLCTVRGKSDRAYVIVENSQWNVNIDQADVDAILEYWENSSLGDFPDTGIYDLNTQYFGTPPDAMDHDDRIYILWYDFEISADGFFFSFDEEPDGTYSDLRSNECEVLYMNCNGVYGPNSPYMLAVIAHEFEHLIHWNYDAFELSWVNEGMAELAMWFFGHPDYISNFNSMPDNSLIDWDGDWADYIKTYLWSLYFYERYGEGAVFDLVHNPVTSIAGYENIIATYGSGESFSDLFTDWVIANFLDDPTVGDGRFGYVGDDLPPFATAGTFSSYPVPVTNRIVQHWAADYYKFTDLDQMGAIEISFDGSDSNEFAVSAIALRANGTTSVMPMYIDPVTQSGSVPVFGLDDPADQVILAVAGISSVGATSYFFTAEQPAADVADDPAEWDVRDRLAEVRIDAAPNPFRSHVQLSLSGAAADEVDRLAVYDSAGRLVRDLADNLVWDGRDRDGRLQAPGVYYIRNTTGNHSVSKEIILVR